MTRKMLWEFLPDFTKALTEQLQRDNERWGDTWRGRIRHGQENRIFARFDDYFDKWKNAGQPIPWLKIVGLAFIAWVRTTQKDWQK